MVLADDIKRARREAQWYVLRGALILFVAKSAVVFVVFLTVIVLVSVVFVAVVGVLPVLPVFRLLLAVAVFVIVVIVVFFRRNSPPEYILPGKTEKKQNIGYHFL